MLPADEKLTALLELESPLQRSIAAESLSINGAGSVIIVAIVDPFQLHLACEALRRHHE